MMMQMDEWKSSESFSEALIVINLFFCGGAKPILTISVPVRLLTSAISWKIGPKSPCNTLQYLTVRELVWTLVETQRTYVAA